MKFNISNALKIDVLNDYVRFYLKLKINIYLIQI